MEKRSIGMTDIIVLSKARSKRKIQITDSEFTTSLNMSHSTVTIIHPSDENPLHNNNDGEYIDVEQKYATEQDLDMAHGISPTSATKQ